LRDQLGIPAGARLVSLFTNVTWDSATIGHDVGFASMFDWIECAIRAAARHSDLALLIRVHPAEGRWGTREEVESTITASIGDMPLNVRFVGPHEALSSYAIVDLSDLILTYTTTVGLEAAVRGKLVAVAGDTHYRGRGFTVDLNGPDDLAQMLYGPFSALGESEIEKALRYAHAFFFRAMIPFPLVEAEEGRVTKLPTRPEEIAPGANPYLDWICDRILDGGSFALPDELVSPSGRPNGTGVRPNSAS
jgi:hypothetical protein